MLKKIGRTNPFQPVAASGAPESANLTRIYDDSGPYTIDGKKVTWTLSSYDPSFVWTGEFASKDTVSGTTVLPSYGESGTWTATRVAVVAHMPETARTHGATRNWGNGD